MGEWRKAIPEKRDRLQSRLLVWLVAPVLVAASLVLVILATHPHNSGLIALKALGVSLTFGVLVWALRAATPMAALNGAMICLVVTAGTTHTIGSPLRSGLAPLVALFALTFLATKAGRGRKASLGLAESRKGRDAAQVIANLGTAALVVIGATFNSFDWLGPRGGLISVSIGVLPAMLLATLCEATADTVSSEIGQAFGGQPIILTTLRRVPAGTDGAVSLIGSAAGIASAAFVAVVGSWGLNIGWQQTSIGFIAGLIGWIFDSLLGATVEYRGWLGNDLVNYLSTLVAAFAAAALWSIWP